MDYGMSNKYEKAKRYAEERSRIKFDALSVTFHGENNDHNVSFDGQQWKCDCHFFQSHDTCAHTMALERVLDKMVPVKVESDA